MGCLDGLNILYDAMSSQELLRIAEVIRALGGRAVALEDVAEEGHPDLLLATSVTTPAYQVCPLTTSWQHLCSVCQIYGAHKRKRSIILVARFISAMLFALE